MNQIYFWPFSKSYTSFASVMMIYGLWQCSKSHMWFVLFEYFLTKLSETFKWYRSCAQCREPANFLRGTLITRAIKSLLAIKEFMNKDERVLSPTTCLDKQKAFLRGEHKKLNFIDAVTRDLHELSQ